MRTLVVGSVILAVLSSSAAFAQSDHRGRGLRSPDQRMESQHTETLSTGDTVPYKYMEGGKYIHYAWREAGLREPPKGYAWMKIGDDFLLADQRSGLIRDVRRGSEQTASLTAGGKVPYEYMVGGKYIHYAWRESGLREPPSGYAWMKIRDRYVLADQRTGAIRDTESVNQPRPSSFRSGYEERRR